MTENRDNYIRTYRKTEMGNTLMAGKDITISAGGNLSARSSILASEHGKVTLAAGDDVTLSNGYNEARDDYGLKYKEKGLLSGGGLGFTVGSEKRKDRYDSTGLTHKGSTVGSAKGNVSLTSGKDMTLEASTLASGKDLTLFGKNVTITSKDNVYTHQEEHEYKRNGLSVSL